MEIQRLKNAATRIYFPLIDSNNRPEFFTGTVWADLTNEVIQATFDDGTADQALTITGTPAESGTITGSWYLALTAAQMNHDLITIKLNADEIDEQEILINTVLVTNISLQATAAALTTHNTALTNHNAKLSPVALDGGSATIGGMLTKIADDNGGADFDAETDSLNKLATLLAAVERIVRRLQSLM